MPDDYDLPIDETAVRLEHIERRLDNMSQRIAYLEGNLGQRVAFLEGAVLGPEKHAQSRSSCISRMDVTIGMLYVALVLNILIFILV